MELKYENGLLPQFNGNISAQSWSSGLSLPNMFNYEYDKLGRLSKAASTGIVMSEELSYDEMDNISGLNRDNSGMKSYSYDGSKLLSVNGLTGQYNYDINGNVIKDGRNGMNLTYNSLNLPVSATDGTNYLNYVYDATGRRLARYINGSVRTYINGIEAAEGNVDVIHTEEGVARNNGSGGYSYEYNLSDHLGNVRATFYQNPANQQTEVIQRDDYYAFGLRKMNSPNSNTNKYLYNGKELQEELGQYDYGARFYDPIIGRWSGVDPLAEEMRRYSPYNYVFNNPLKFTDPDGMKPYNEYEVIVQGGQVQRTTMTGTKGGDVTDYVTVVNLDAAPYASGITNYTVDVQTGYTSGVAADEGAGSQKRHPTPGVRQLHGSIPTDLQAYSILALDFVGRYALGALFAKPAAQGTSKLWGFWSDYEKVAVGGGEYAKIGERLYTRHAVDRMIPSGFGSGGRSVSPNLVEAAIHSGTATNSVVNGVLRTTYTSGTVSVVTEQSSKIVVTVITK